MRLLKAIGVVFVALLLGATVVRVFVTPGHRGALTREAMGELRFAQAVPLSGGSGLLAEVDCRYQWDTRGYWGAAQMWHLRRPPGEATRLSGWNPLGLVYGLSSAADVSADGTVAATLMYETPKGWVGWLLLGAGVLPDLPTRVQIGRQARVVWSEVLTGAPSNIDLSPSSGDPILGFIETRGGDDASAQVLRLVDAITGSQVRSVELPEGLSAGRVEWSPGGDRLAVTGHMQNAGHRASEVGPGQRPSRLLLLDSGQADFAEFSIPPGWSVGPWRGPIWGSDGRFVWVGKRSEEEVAVARYYPESGHTEDWLRLEAADGKADPRFHRIEWTTDGSFAISSWGHRLPPNSDPGTPRLEVRLHSRRADGSWTTQSLGRYSGYRPAGLARDGSVITLTSPKQIALASPQNPHEATIWRIEDLPRQPLEEGLAEFWAWSRWPFVIE